MPFEKTMINPSQMQIGDTVRYVHFGTAWNVAIVKQKTDKEVTLFRPYGTMADFVYTGGVICYVGIEQYQISILGIDAPHEYELLERKNLK